MVTLLLLCRPQWKFISSFSGQGATTSSANEAEKVLHKPYLLQVKLLPVVIKTSSYAAALLGVMLELVPLELPLKSVYQEFSDLLKFIAKCDATIESHKEVLNVTFSFRKALTRVEITIQKTKVEAGINRSPVNVVFSKQLRRLRLAPDLNFDQVYGASE